MVKLIETGEQAAQCVARGLAFAYVLRERQENASVKQLLIAADMVPAEISGADWSAGFAQLVQPRLRYLLNSMVQAERIAGGDPIDLLSRIVHAKTGQTTRVHRRLVEQDEQLEREVDERLRHKRSNAAIKANETRGPEGRHAAARKAVATRKGIPFEE